VGPIDPGIAARIFLQASQGLAAIHELGVVHRDIKPSNIFLHESDGALSVKVCDFGVAKNTMTEGTGSDLTHTGGIIGSPHYMSPEQVQDSKRVDHRSDLWSLSMAMYEALSGHKGWASCSTVGELLVAVCTRDLPWLQEEAPWVPGELAAVVHRNLQRSPAERFQSAAAMAAALAPLAAPAEALTSPDALAVSDQVRSERAPDLRNLAQRDTSAANRTTPPERASSSRTLIAGALLAGLLAAGLGALQTRKDPPAAPTASVQGRLRVPTQASVWVRGERQTSADGWLKLGGHPGEAILVAIEHQGARVEKTVTLTSGGQVVPGEIELPTPPPLASASAPPAAPAASTAPDPSAAAEPPRPGRPPRPGQPAAPAAPTTAPTTAPTPTPTTAPTPAPTLKLQKEW
jgi:serine/threonine-protein kinase